MSHSYFSFRVECLRSRKNNVKLLVYSNKPNPQKSLEVIIPLYTTNYTVLKEKSK